MSDAIPGSIDGRHAIDGTPLPDPGTRHWERGALGRAEDTLAARAALDVRLAEREAAFDVMRFRELEARWQRETAGYRDTNDRLQADRAELRRLEDRIAEIRRVHRDAGALVPLADLERDAAGLRERIARLTRERDAAHAEGRALGELVARARGLLAEQAVLGDWNTRRQQLLALDAGGAPPPVRRVLPAPARRRGARIDWPAELQALRGEIEALRAERAAVEAAPRPLAEAEARARESVARLAAGRASMAPWLVAPGGDGDAPRSLPIDLTNEGIGSASVLPLLAALQPKRLVELLVADAKAHLEQHPAGLPEAERAAELERLDGALLDAELREEATIRAAEREGIRLARRGDADLRAVLAFFDDSSEPREAA